ncbi:9536_t:CDS:2, partial [Acaulospora colombiana]
NLEKDMVSSAAQLHQYSFVDREKASIEVDIEDDYVVFNNLNKDFQSRGYSRMPYRVKSTEVSIVRSVIQAASDFHTHLTRAPQDGVLREYVDVEFVKVKRPLDRNFGPMAQDADAGNLCKNGLVEVTAGETLYGIKITNNSPLPLYPHLFLFECKSYYTPPIVAEQDHEAPLQPKGTFTIGYGRVGETPWTHCVGDDEEVYQSGKVVQDEQDIDICVFKLFLTSKPTDLSDIEQPSPFPGDARKTRRYKWGKEEWDAVSITVVPYIESQPFEERNQSCGAPDAAQLQMAGFDLNGLTALTSFQTSLAKVIRMPWQRVVHYVTSKFGLKRDNSKIITLGAGPVKSTGPSQLPEESIDDQPRHLSALLIGIDDYLDPNDRLLGSVNDAKDLESYLKEVYPSARIISLHNNEATRDSIIEAINSLIHDEMIERQDPILIFYAGHGGEAEPPVDWGLEGKKIQALIPQNYADGSNVITDRGFCALLEELRKAKGDNIKGTRRTRAIRLTKPLPNNVDSDIFTRNGTDGAQQTSSTRSFYNQAVSSHVLLAACGESEFAIEDGGRGAFTRALLETIKRLGFTKFTYSDIIRNLPALP